MKRKTPQDKMKFLRKSAIQESPHMPLTDRMGTTENKIRKEIAIMKKCRHAHVVRLLEVIDDRMKHKIYMGEYVIAIGSPSFMSASQITISPVSRYQNLRFIRHTTCSFI
jgi:hypothetical protein